MSCFGRKDEVWVCTVEECNPKVDYCETAEWSAQSRHGPQVPAAVCQHQHQARKTLFLPTLRKPTRFALAAAAGTPEPPTGCAAQYSTDHSTDCGVFEGAGTRRHRSRRGCRRPSAFSRASNGLLSRGSQHLTILRAAGVVAVGVATVVAFCGLVDELSGRSRRQGGEVEGSTDEKRR